MSNVRSSSLFLVLTFLFLFILKAKSEDNNKEEAIFSVKYMNYSFDFTVFIINDSVFIPLEEVISYFKIYYKIDDNKKIDGYINVADSSYYFDFNNKELKNIVGLKSSIDDDMWFTNGLQIYARTDLFAKVFNFEIRTLFNQLTVSIQSKYELPIVRIDKIAYISNNFKKEIKNESFGPLIGEKSFKILNGGILDYTLGGNFSGPFQNYSFGGNLGLELLGGEFQINSQGNVNMNKFTLNNNNIRWRYIFDSPLIQSLSLGNLSYMSYRATGSRGFRKPNYNLRGGQITNQTTKLPTNFSNYIIEDKIEPDWNVELYLDNQLFDVKRADLNGYYRFEIPINYGMTNITVKYYGPKGEFISKEKVVNVSSELLPPGNLQYLISGGEDLLTKKRVVDGSLYLGITDWLTTSLSGTKVESSSDYSIVSQSSINFLKKYMISILATNSGVYEASIRIPQSFFGSLDIFFTSFDLSKNNSIGNQINTLQFMTTINRFSFFPFSLTINGIRNKYKTSATNMLNSNVMFNINTLNFNIRYYVSLNESVGNVGNITQSASSSMSYYISDLPEFISFLNRSRFNISTSFDPANWKFSDFSSSLDFQLSKDIFMNFSYSYNVTSKLSSMNLGLNLNFQEFRSRGTVNYIQGNKLSYTGDLNGSLEFDSYNMKFSMISTLGSNSNVGRSSAAIRFYNDKNYNNKFDDNDVLLPEVDFQVTNEMATKNTSKGYIILSNLIPGQKYNIKVNIGSFSNPSLIPDYTEFSFIAEPYSYKSLDIACHMGGIIDGKTDKLTSEGKEGQGGLKIHIKSKNSNYSTIVNVFSDGSYFFSGLPVGEYHVFVDSLQLNILKCTSKPTSYNLKIEPLAEGDYRSNINFELSPIGGVKPRVLDTAATPLKPAKDTIPVKIASNLSKQKEVKPTKLGTKSENKTIENIIPKSQTEQKDTASVDSEITYEKPSDKDIILLFASKKTTFLSNGMMRQLDKIAKYLMDNPKSKLSVVGHTDIFGSLEEHQKISEQRASEVRTYLVVKKGIDKMRIFVSGKGSLIPAAENNTEANRKKNRRVVLKIMD